MPIEYRIMYRRRQLIRDHQVVVPVEMVPTETGTFMAKVRTKVDAHPCDPIVRPTNRLIRDTAAAIAVSIDDMIGLHVVRRRLIVTNRYR